MVEVVPAGSVVTLDDALPKLHCTRCVIVPDTSSGSMVRLMVCPASMLDALSVPLLPFGSYSM